MDSQAKRFSMRVGGRLVPIPDTMGIVSALLIVASIYVPWAFIQTEGQTWATIYIGKFSVVNGTTTSVFNLSNMELGRSLAFLNLLLGLAVIAVVVLTGVDRSTQRSALMNSIGMALTSLAGASVLTTYLTFLALGAEIAKTALPTATTPIMEQSFGLQMSLIAGLLLLTSAFLRRVKGESVLTIRMEDQP